MALLTEAFLPKVDGVTKTSYLTIRYLQESGREVLVFAPDTSIDHVGKSEVVRLPSFPLSLAPETRVAVPNNTIFDRLADFQPDLIHLASPALMSIYGMIFGREHNIPVVANYQTDLAGYAVHYGAPLLETPVRHWLRYVHNGCHVSLVPTQKIQQALQGQGFKRLRVWGRGVNGDHFNPLHYRATMRQRLLNGRATESLLCVYVGRLANEKQVDLLIEVAQLEGVSLTIIGDGYMRADLETLFDGTGTVFTGYMVGDELSQAFASADVFLFTGGNETFGQVVQEALASGLPAIVTNRGSVGELVQNGETGFIVEHSPQGFAEATRYLRDNPAHRIQMAKNARHFAEKRPWSSLMRQLETHYSHAVTLNRLFKQRFGKTRYHRTARWRTTLNVWATWLASAFYRPRFKVFGRK